MKRLGLLFLIVSLTLVLSSCGGNSSWTGDDSDYDEGYYEERAEEEMDDYYAGMEKAQQEGAFDDACMDSGAVTWDEAINYVGQHMAVFGNVCDTYYASDSEGSPVFINLGGDYESGDYFTIVIWEENQSAFGMSGSELAEYYEGKRVLVQGTVEKYDGHAEIHVNSPDDMIDIRNYD